MIALTGLIASACRRQLPAVPPPDPQQTAVAVADSVPERPLKRLPVEHPVRIRHFFAYIDSIIACEDTLTPYPLTEHLLVRANPWIIDTLANTDYYRMMARDSFVYDQESLIVLRPGDTILLPGPQAAGRLMTKMAHTWIDINIPEYRLRIAEGEDTLFTFPVRVGRNQKRYLALAGTTVDLRTQPGEGQIVRIARYPLFLDPHTGRRFTHTRRDDGRVTLMPLIPWIEPAVDGRRYGQMIHPTTNPGTLGRAYSNGCIGTREADAWYVYYYAPPGTPVRIRYDLAVTGANGDTLYLRDIYHWKNKFRAQMTLAAGKIFIPRDAGACLCDPRE